MSTQPTPVPTSDWRERSKTDLVNISYIWLRIGDELMPELADFISQVEQEAYNRGKADTVAEVRKSIEHMPIYPYKGGQIKHWEVDKHFVDKNEVLSLPSLNI